MLGHKNAAMTLDTYADLFDTDLDDVATSISNRIAAAETLNAEDDFELNNVLRIPFRTPPFHLNKVHRAEDPQTCSVICHPIAPIGTHCPYHGTICETRKNKWF